MSNAKPKEEEPLYKVEKADVVFPDDAKSYLEIKAVPSDDYSEAVEGEEIVDIKTYLNDYFFFNLFKIHNGKIVFMVPK